MTNKFVGVGLPDDPHNIAEIKRDVEDAIPYNMILEPSCQTIIYLLIKNNSSN